MATTLPADFREFLRLLSVHGVEYLLVGGYAVGYHGYPRATGDMDVWVAVSAANAARLVDVLRQFGFDTPGLSPSLFMRERNIIRMGVPPLKIEITTHVDGVSFQECHDRRTRATIDGVEVSILSLDDLKVNKKASGRPKDLADLENLP